MGGDGAEGADEVAAALHDAVRSRDSVAVAKLAAEGANVDAAEPSSGGKGKGKGKAGGAADGCAPLYIAVRQGDVETVRVLLQHGADANVSTGGGSTPLCRAAQNGAFGVLELLLEDPNIRVDQPRHGGRTPLFVAAQHGHGQCVEALLEAGADATIGIKASKRKTGRRTWTAMDVAEKARADETDPVVSAQFGVVVSVLKCVEPQPAPKPSPRSEPDQPEPELEPDQPEPELEPEQEPTGPRRNERRQALAIEEEDLEVIEMDATSSDGTAEAGRRTAPKQSRGSPRKTGKRPQPRQSRQSPGKRGGQRQASQKHNRAPDRHRRPPRDHSYYSDSNSGSDG
jgi:hypothetical protein